jgi:hypothetical protein
MSRLKIESARRQLGTALALFLMIATQCPFTVLLEAGAS